MYEFRDIVKTVQRAFLLLGDAGSFQRGLQVSLVCYRGSRASSEGDNSSCATMWGSSIGEKGVMKILLFV